MQSGRCKYHGRGWRTVREQAITRALAGKPPASYPGLPPRSLQKKIIVVATLFLLVMSTKGIVAHTVPTE